MSEPNVKPENGHAHEQTDAKTGSLFRLAVALAIFVAAAMLVMGMLFSYFTERETAADTSVSPLAKDAPPAPPEPRLQPDPRLDLQRLREEKDEQLNTFDWVDQEEGIVRIPIDRAIELMAERGFPARAESPGQN